MKIAISSLGTILDSGIDLRFGRARYFLVIETDTDEVLQVVDNLEQQHAQHGAGVQAAQSVADSGVGWVLTGNVGPNAFQLLSAAGIKVGVGAEGTVREALDKFRSGGFDAAEAATRGGHDR